MNLVLKSKHPVARKPHACDNCGQRCIQPGDKYRRTSCVSDGRVYDWVSCAGCDAIFLDVWTWAGDPDEGIGPDSFQEWAREHAETDERAAAYLAKIGATA